MVGSSERSLGIQVDHDTVLKAAKIIHEVAQRRLTEVSNDLRSLRMVAPGNDSISHDSARAWNDLLFTGEDSHANRLVEYFTGLLRLAERLGETARHYGYNESEVAAAFGSVMQKAEAQRVSV